MTHVDSIRHRPGMYVGECNGHGVLQLVLEVVGNAFDQHLAGRCTRVDIAIADEDTITIADNGPGIPIDPHGDTTFLESVLTRRHDTATADGHAPHVHLALGGGGLAVVNALSAQLTVVVVRDGASHRIVCREGRVVEPLLRAPTDASPGTRFTFRPDPTIFTTTRVPRLALSERLEDLSFLAPGLRLRWSFEGDAAATQGLAGLVARDLGAALGPIAHGRGRVGDVDVEVAFAWSGDRHRDREPALHGFVNLGRTPLGTHVAGLLSALRTLVPRGVSLPSAALQRGLVAVVSVILPDVRFGNPTRDKLITPEAQRAVAEVARGALRAWATAHPDALARVLEHAQRR